MKNLSKGAIIGITSAFVLLVVGLSLYGKANGINNTAVSKETALSAAYQDNQNELSNYISGFYEQTGLAQAKSAQMDKILTDAIKGRYDKGSSAQPQGGAMFSAMVEAYPDLAGLNVYDKILLYVQAGRQDYKEKQSKLLDMLRSYDRWRNSGIINSRLVRLMGVPTQNLQARIGGEVTYGAEAERQMYRIVLTQQAKAAYETGTMEPLKVPA